MSTKSPFEFVFWCWEFTKVLVKSKGYSKMFILNLSGLQLKKNIYILAEVCTEFISAVSIEKTHLQFTYRVSKKTFVGHAE